jgi:hypothetical protein
VTETNVFGLTQPGTFSDPLTEVLRNGIAAHRELIHKIGVTGGKVEARIAHASTDATYLLADVEVIATYKLYNINRSKLENLIHRVFSAACLDLTIEDRFGRPVRPREWFLVPLAVIDDVVDKIRDRSITEFEYDPASASLKKIAPTQRDRPRRRRQRPQYAKAIDTRPSQLSGSWTHIEPPVSLKA